MEAKKTTPAGSNVYRTECPNNGFDPGRGRTFSSPARFYTHTIPPGFHKKILNL
jgi:hypothetical protein